MSTQRAVRIHQPGGPEALRVDQVDLDEPGPGEVRVRHEAIGVNFIDAYHRSGLYPVPSLPATIGMEAAGVVEAVGPGVEDLAVGDRVGYATAGPGAYADTRVLPAAAALALPAELDARSAAAVMLKGMTVEYLVRRCFPVSPGMLVVFHAAAGGTGLLACQWLADLGATTIGVVGSPEKAELARQHGCHHPVVRGRDDLVATVRALSDGRGAAVVYDSVGQATLDLSLDCLARRGTLVSFGNASGPPRAVDPLELGRRGSLFLTRPSLMDYTAGRRELEDSASAVFDAVLRGALRPVVGQTHALDQAAEAHAALEARRTVGATLLLP
jgi:NADPH2:quinone reductase